MPSGRMTLGDLVERLQELSGIVSRSAAISVSDPEVSRYARVLEYGSVAGRLPWPRPGERTTLAVDPETGAQMVVSVSAPEGFVRVRAGEFLNRLRDELGQPANWLDAAEVDLHLAASVSRAAASALEELRAAVPRQSGRLAQSLMIADD